MARKGSTSRAGKGDRGKSVEAEKGSAGPGMNKKYEVVNKAGKEANKVERVLKASVYFVRPPSALRLPSSLRKLPQKTNKKGTKSASR